MTRMTILCSSVMLGLAAVRGIAEPQAEVVPGPVVVTTRDVIGVATVKPLPDGLGAAFPRKPKPGPVLTVSFSPDGRLALAGAASADNAVVLVPGMPRSSSGVLAAWDLQTKQMVPLAPKDFVLEAKASPAFKQAAFFTHGRRVFVLLDGGEAFIYEAKGAKKPQPLQLRGPLSVEAAAFNGKQLLLDAGDNSFQLWDAESGKPLRAFIGHAHGLNSIAFMPNGDRVLSASDDKSVRLWDTKTGKQLRRLDLDRAVQFVAPFADNHALFVWETGELQLWNVEKWEEVQQWGLPLAMKSPDAFVEGQRSNLMPALTTQVTCVATSPKGRHVLLGLRDSTVRLWDLEQSKEPFLFAGHAKEHGISALAFAPDGRSFLSGSEDGTMRRWMIPENDNLAKAAAPAVGRPTPPFERKDTDPTLTLRATRTLAAAFTRDGKRVVTSNEVPRIRPEAPALLKKGLPAFQPGLPGESFREDSIMRVWTFDPANEVRRTNVFPSGITCIALSTSGKTALTGCGGPMPADSTVGVWDLETGKLLRSFKGHGGGAGSVAFSADNKRAVSGATRTPGIVEPLRDFTVFVWEVSSGRMLQRLTGHTQPVTSVAFSPDGKFVLTAAGPVSGGAPIPPAIGGKVDTSIRIWDSFKGRQILELAGHAEGVGCAVYSPDGKRILSGGADKMLRLWDAKTGKEIRQLSGHTAAVNTVAFSADGKYALSGTRFGDGSVRMWDLEAGKEIARFVAGGSGVMTVGFSPTSDRILAVADNEVRAWRNPTIK